MRAEMKPNWESSQFDNIEATKRTKRTETGPDLSLDRTKVFLSKFSMLLARPRSIPIKWALVTRALYTFLLIQGISIPASNVGFAQEQKDAKSQAENVAGKFLNAFDAVDPGTVRAYPVDADTHQG
jgi:hypothetical protein